MNPIKPDAPSAQLLPTPPALAASKKPAGVGTIAKTAALTAAAAASPSIQTSPWITYKGSPQKVPHPLFREKNLNSSSHYTPSPLVERYRRHADIQLKSRQFDSALDSYTQALQEAESQKDIVGIAKSLEGIGQVFLEKERWAAAAKVFNGALALYQKKEAHEGSKQFVLSLMVEVERRFLNKEGKGKLIEHRLINPESYVQRQKQFKEMRQHAFKEIEIKLLHTPFSTIESYVPLRQILEGFSHKIRLFLEEILQQGYSQFGQPPCLFTMISLGSLARKEMSPYSDLEFAILVEKTSPEFLNYFRILVKWLEIQIIYLGETEIKILNHGQVSPVGRGFSFDDGGNTPLGKEGYIELIKTPKELAQCQSKRFYEEDLILSNTLCTTSVLAGNQTLHQEYLKEMYFILNSPTDQKSLSLRQQRSLDILKGHLVEFEPRIDKEKEDTTIFNIKAELYRLPSFLLAGLADYVGVESQSSWDKIDILEQKNFISLEGARNLREALEAIMRLRVRCHLHYGRECDEAYHPSMLRKEQQLEHVFVLSEAEVSTILKIYAVLLPLHRIFKEVCKTKNFKSLAKASFYDDSLHTQGQAYRRLHKFEEAKKCYQQALILNPDNLETQVELAGLLIELAQHAEAENIINKALLLASKEKNDEELGRLFNLKAGLEDIKGNYTQATSLYEKSLEILRRVCGDREANVAITLGNLGVALGKSGQIRQAVEYFKEALEIEKSLHGNEHPRVALYLNDLGAAYVELAEWEKAVESYKEAVRISKKIYGDMHAQVALTLGGLGYVYVCIRKAEEAVPYLEKSLRIFVQLYGCEHPKVALRLDMLGRAWQILEENEKASYYLKEALEIFRKFYQDDHPNIASTISSLGTLHQATGDLRQSIQYFEEALSIHRKTLGRNHHTIGIDLNNLGLALIHFGKPETAIPHLEEALQIFAKTLGNEHPEVATTRSNLGMALSKIGKHKKAIASLEEAIRIKKIIWGDKHANITPTLMCLAETWKVAGNPNKAIEYCHEILAIDKERYGSEHPKIAQSIHNIGEIYRVAGAPQQALEYYQQALAIDRKHYSEAHPEIAIRFNCMGLAWFALKEKNKAIECLEKSLKITQQTLGDNHPKVLLRWNNLGYVLSGFGEIKKARKCFEQALVLARSIYGPTHPQTLLQIETLSSCGKK